MTVFDGRKFTVNEQNVADVIKGRARDIDAWLDHLPPSREKSLALTKLEECVMWAQKAIGLHGITDEATE